MSGGSIRIFVLGAYRSIGKGKPDMELLEGLRNRLRVHGYDAFLAIDHEAQAALGGAEPPPLEMTEALSRRSDALFFVFTSTGRLEGVASELTTLQIRAPEDASSRVVFYEEGYPLSSILDPDQDGVLATPPVAVVPFRGSEDLYEAAVDYAGLIRRWGAIR